MCSSDLPVDPETPTEPIEPGDPETPIEPEEPIEPADPETPTEPVDPEVPADPVDPEAPTEPVDPEAPTELENPLGSPAIEVTVTTEKDIYKPGELISYTIVVTNTGDVDLENVAIIDELVGGKALGELAVQSEIVSHSRR